ncbi:hypothetical protein [Streptomyces flavofungini]|uniref:DUF4190 domain-containing protein n=1 Tax=Streptomyces flavofungini TaxID=68200 RepID=A0ABS0X7J6_9ACTN|nr:hypothetical protein [Streptomyces flavofungini]MBJ3809187.1 hypothetical protein [Streptomyces flavofungini]GHC69005.1 hypothetical protein GCM10010349_43670 [Streptomyces flavofungini]
MIRPVGDFATPKRAVYLLGPAAIGAVITGLVAQRGMRSREGADPFRARMGVALGTTAVVLPLILLIWVIWALSQVQP